MLRITQKAIALLTLCLVSVMLVAVLASSKTSSFTPSTYASSLPSLAHKAQAQQSSALRIEHSLIYQGEVGLFRLAGDEALLQSHQADYIWGFGEADSQTTTMTTPEMMVEHVYDEPGEYTVSVAVVQGDERQLISRCIVVRPTPIRGLALTHAAITGVLPNQFGFEAAPASGKASGYTWAYGDGIIDRTEVNSAQHVYVTPGYYLASVTASGPEYSVGACGSSTTERSTARQITVVAAQMPLPDSNISLHVSGRGLLRNGPRGTNGEPSIVEVAVGEEVTLLGQGFEVANKYIWRFGDETEAVTDVPTINHTFLRSGTHVVSIVTSSDGNTNGNTNGSTAGNAAGSTVDNTEEAQVIVVQVQAFNILLPWILQDSNSPIPGQEQPDPIQDFIPTYTPLPTSTLEEVISDPTPLTPIPDPTDAPTDTQPTATPTNKPGTVLLPPTPGIPGLTVTALPTSSPTITPSPSATPEGGTSLLPPTPTPTPDGGTVLLPPTTTPTRFTGTSLLPPTPSPSTN